MIAPPFTPSTDILIAVKERRSPGRLLLVDVSRPSDGAYFPDLEISAAILTSQLTGVIGETVVAHVGEVKGYPVLTEPSPEAIAAAQRFLST